MSVTEIGIIFAPLTFLILAVLTDIIAMYLLIKESFVSASLINEQFDKHVE